MAKKKTASRGATKKSVLKKYPTGVGARKKSVSKKAASTIASPKHSPKTTQLQMSQKDIASMPVSNEPVLWVDQLAVMRPKDGSVMQLAFQVILPDLPAISTVARMVTSRTHVKQMVAVLQKSLDDSEDGNS